MPYKNEANKAEEAIIMSEKSTSEQNNIPRTKTDNT
jgi:hypothetical protein